MSGNPYQVSQPSYAAPPEYATRQAEYTEDTQLGPYAPPNPAYADKLGNSVNGTPDPLRTQSREPEAYRQGSRIASFFWRMLGLDRAEREAAQTPRHANIESKGIAPGTKRFADKPGVRAADEHRITAQLSPMALSLSTRPFTGNTPKRFTGVHSSLADHRRAESTIFGMRPAYRSRSTYRLDPVPWGERVIDQQAISDDFMGAQPQVERSETPNQRRANRLG